MLLNAPEDLSLAALLRKNSARLRRRTQRSETEVPNLTVAEAPKTPAPAAVPLVLSGDTERRLIPRLLHRMRWKRFLRYCPDTLDEYAPLQPDSAHYFLQRLRTGRIDAWKECLVSTWALGRLTADDPARAEAGRLLIPMVETNGGGLAWLDGRRLASHWKGVYLSLFLCLTLWGGAHPAVFMIENGMPPLTVFLKFLCFPAITALPLSLSVTVLSFLVGLPLDIKRMNRIRMMALLTLGRWRDPRHLGLILREYVGQKGRMHRAAEVALREVLPLLEACETAESTRDFVPNLCKALQRKERQVLDYTPQEEALEMLLLEALGKVGDGRALPAVERIAQRGRTLALQGLAQNILPVLQSRARLVNDPVQLLRGVARPDPAPATLLRPARNEDLTPPDQLLRLPGAVEPTHRPITIQRPGS